MLAKGGKLLYAAPNYPVRPDGGRYGDSLTEIFGEKNAGNIVVLKEFPEKAKIRELAKRFNVEVNSDIKSEQPLLTYRFSRDREEMLLIINRSGVESLVCELPEGSVDFFNGERLTGQIKIGPGLFRFVKQMEREGK